MSRAVPTKHPPNVKAAGQLQFNRPQVSQRPFGERPRVRPTPRVLRFAIPVFLVIAALLVGACDNSSAPKDTASTPGAASTESSAGTETGTLIAFDARSGEELWRVRPPMGTVGGPVAAEGLVFVQGGETCNSIEGTLVAYEAETGEERWRASALSECGGATALSVADGVAVVKDGETLRGLDADSGDELWTSPVASDSSELLRVNAGDVALVWEDGTFQALDRHSGEDRWTMSATTGAGPSPPPEVDATTAFFRFPPCTSVAIDLPTGAERWRLALPPEPFCIMTAGDHVVVRCVDSVETTREAEALGVITGWDGVTGKQRWNVRMEKAFCGPDLFVAFAPSSVYVLAGDKLEALDAASGAQRWRVDAPSFPIATGPVSRVATDDDVVVVIVEHIVVAYDARSGERLWEMPTPDYAAASAWVAGGIAFLSWSGPLAYPD